MMEGVLFKWTNYWSGKLCVCVNFAKRVKNIMVQFLKVMCLFILGWQTRWFILDNGVLAYYKSQEEVNQGCKGSMKVTACEIIGNYNFK
jgi:pleckstrin family protein A (phosphoinositide binding specific) protein 8